MPKNAKLIHSIMSRFALHSVPRSGSSWVGAVLNKHPDINYFFQPLFSNSFAPTLTDKSSYEDIIKFYDELRNTNDSFVQQLRFGEQNHLRNKDSNNILYKEVRYHHIVENLLQKDPTIKIIGLIRNPLGVINSWLKAPKEFRRDLKWNELDEWKNAHKKNLNKEEEFNGFNKWKETSLLFERLSTMYPDSFYLIQYSELLHNSTIAFEGILKHLNLEMHEDMLSFIDRTKSSSINNIDSYSIHRIKTVDDGWKTQLNPIIVKAIQNELKDSILEKYLL